MLAAKTSKSRHVRSTCIYPSWVAGWSQCIWVLCMQSPSFYITNKDIISAKLCSIQPFHTLQPRHVRSACTNSKLTCRIRWFILLVCLKSVFHQSWSQLYISSHARDNLLKYAAYNPFIDYPWHVKSTCTCASWAARWSQYIMMLCRQSPSFIITNKNISVIS